MVDTKDFNYLLEEVFSDEKIKEVFVILLSRFGIEKSEFRVAIGGDWNTMRLETCLECDRRNKDNIRYYNYSFLSSIPTSKLKDLSLYKKSIQNFNLDLTVYKRLIEKNSLSESVDFLSYTKKGSTSHLARGITGLLTLFKTSLSDYKENNQPIYYTDKTENSVILDSLLL